MLKSDPGNPRDRDAEALAFQQAPLRNLVTAFPDLLKAFFENEWRTILVLAPRWNRAIKAAQRSSKASPAPIRSDLGLVPLTAAVKARAAELGISAIGVAEYDDKYTFVPQQIKRDWVGNRIIVCLMETNYEAMQTAPSALAERAALAGNIALIERTAKLATYVQELGFHAAANHDGGLGINIYYAVQAGLGQLGLNGQLLTPVAGPRCRIIIIQTDAPLVLDTPVDYGIPKICDACKVCVRRCPPGAIPSRRSMYRGVEKAKIKLTRCWPTTVQAHGCAVCAKVCPVQKFGLIQVLDEFARSGRILGKDTDELESYEWVDGRRYGVGARPKLERAWFEQSLFATITDDAATAVSSESKPDDGESSLTSM